MEGSDHHAAATALISVCLLSICSSTFSSVLALITLVSRFSLTFQGNYVKAELLYERSQTIREKVLGLDHPDVAQSLNNRAALLQSQVTAVVKCQEASQGPYFMSKCSCSWRTLF